MSETGIEETETEEAPDRRVLAEEKYVYVGEYQDSFKHGRGVLVFKDEFVKKIVRVVGIWKENKIDTSKMVQILYKNGNFYSGFINHKLERHGRGILRSDSYIFTGNFKNGKKDGKGREVSKNVTITGQYQNGMKHGFCVLEFHDDKTKIVGCWKNDVVNGYAVIHFGNKDRYEGEIRRGIITGKGKMQYASGSIYEGEFLFKQKHGYGVFSTYIDPPKRPKKQSIIKKISSGVSGGGEYGSSKEGYIQSSSSLDNKVLDKSLKGAKGRNEQKLKKRKCVYEGVFRYDAFQRGIFCLKNEYIMGTWGPTGQPSGDRIEHMIHDPVKQESRYYYGYFTIHGYPKDPKKYKLEPNHRYIIQSRNKLEQVISVESKKKANPLVEKKKANSTPNPADLHILLRQRNFTRSQVFYYDTGVIRPLDTSPLVLDLNYTNYNLNIYNTQKRNKNKQSNKIEKLETVQLMAEKVLWSSVQKWYYDGNSFRSYYDVKKYILNIGDNTEWALIRSDKFPRKPIQGRKYMIQSCVTKEYLCVHVDPKNREKQTLTLSKLQVFRVRKKKPEKIVIGGEEIDVEPEERVGRNFVWNFQHGQLVNLGTGKMLVLNAKNIPGIEDCQILVPQKGVPDPDWLFDGSMFIYKQTKCLCLGRAGNLTTMVWSSKKKNLSWNLINVE